MRILIDLQACQSTGSRTRGIGRYSLSLAKAMARQAGQHELHLALNGVFPDAIPDLRREFADLLPHQHIHTWHALTSVSAANAGFDARRVASELVREEAFAQIKPDIVHVSSLFEGLGDDAVTNVHALNMSTTAVTLYDLIPLIHSQQYLGDPTISRWYYQKIQALKNADLLLAISNSSREEALTWLQSPPANVVNISSAVDERFAKTEYAPEVLRELLLRYGLIRPFVMYTGGIDLRKNIEKLIGAYARLPLAIRAQHQLAIVCSVHDADRQRLMKLARDEGLQADELILTGFVADEELPMLYHACKLFVFPSWHEGFGLPALEAMTCGAPVITANTSSLPEVMGFADAMFDPFQESSITQKMYQALVDDGFRASLSVHGLERAKKFSWDASAKTALAAFEEKYVRQQASKKTSIGFSAAKLESKSKPSLAYISPIPPEQTGIADYSAELLPELARYYEIHIVSDQTQTTDPWLLANFSLHSVAWFHAHAEQFDRILYHVGNSAYHSHMFDLLRAHPGVVVLHDFYISNIVSHLEHTGMKPNFWTQSLYEAHGYSALVKNARTKNVHEVIWQFPCNAGVVEPAKGIIVHSQFSLTLAEQWYGKQVAQSWTYIPHLRCLPQAFVQSEAKQSLDLKESDFLVCAFGMLGPTKLNHQLLQAWLDSDLARNPNCYLVFVGQNDGGDYGAQLLSDIAQSACAERVRITGFAEPELFKNYLHACDLAIQLRTMSRGETSGTVLDCMAHGIATIINANGTMAELPADALLKLPDTFAQAQLVQAIQHLYQDAQARCELGQKAIQHIRDHHQAFQIGQRYRDAIETYFVSQPLDQRDQLYRQLQHKMSVLHPSHLLGDAELQQLAAAIAGNALLRGKRLLVDVSRLAEVDANSGIQRVVRAILQALINDQLIDGRVEPVILTPQGLRFARRFTSQLMVFPELQGDGDLLEVGVNDVFLGLDLHFESIIENRQVLQACRDKGMRLLFVIYDLLPILKPEFFADQLVSNFIEWLSTVVNTADGAICISRSVQFELQAWIAEHFPKQVQHFKLGHFHLGADIIEDGLQPNVQIQHQDLQQALTQQTCFLMVGTIEPRKGHTQSLDAFEELWRNGENLCLVIVGGRGWKTDALQARIAAHPELNKRLFWLDQADDAILTYLYRHCACLLAASYGEGFGLPLIEAARYQLAILARRLPVFVEVAGEYASYFEGDSAANLTDAVGLWLTLYRQNNAPGTADMPWLNWHQSAAQLCNALNRVLN